MLAQIRRDYQTYLSLRHRGYWAMVFYRFGRWVNALRPGPVRWLLNGVYSALSVPMPILTGVSLDRETQIGKSFHIIHPGMIAIHPQVKIGDGCGIMHGVTLGTSPTDPGYPTLGNNVFIGVGAVVLGGVTIGDGARIAPLSLVLCDVPPGATAIGVPAKIYPARPSAKPA